EARYAPPSSASLRPRANPVPIRRTSPRSANALQMFAIDDFGSPSRRASSLGPAAVPAFSARRSRIAPARVTAGASDSPSAASSSTGRSIAVIFRLLGRVLARLSASRLNRVLYLDY